MKTPSHSYFAFVARFVDAVTTDALATELLAQRRARKQFEAAQQREADLQSAPLKAA